MVHSRNEREARRKMDGMTYNGYEIKAIPYQLADSEEWTVNITILKHRSDNVASRQFSASNTFKSRDEAVKHCLAFGQQIIDGKSNNCTVADL
jgi:hypothetical protein